MSCQGTRERLIESGYRIISERNLAQLTVENIAEVAGLSPRSFFTHFRSKDDLLVEVLKQLRSANLSMLKKWTSDLEVHLAAEERIEAFFRKVIAVISAPDWKGCCFSRITAEFHDLRGHPIHAVVAEAKRDTEAWLESELRRGRYESPERLARQLGMLLSGLLAMQLVHGKADYGEECLCMLQSLLSAGRLPPHRPASPNVADAVPLTSGTSQEIARASNRVWHDGRVAAPIHLKQGAY